MTDAIEQLVRAVIYEGYSLYPYRPSALKNQRRFAFGVIYPRTWAERRLEPECARVEVVAAAPAGAVVAACVRFLRLERGGGSREHSIDVPAHALGSPDLGGMAERDDLVLETRISSVVAGDGLWRIAIELRNATPLAADADHEDAMDVSPASTHVIVQLAAGTLISSIDPPSRAASAVATCRSLGLYPVLVGPCTVLASPIILPDFPELAPQSPGDFFDGTEIDEMLTLRVLTMTDAEKREAAASDPRIAALIERTEALGIEHTAQLHGCVRTSWPRAGTRVRLRPARRADAFDVLLAGRLAIVAAVERDLEGNVHCAVTLDDDPGADLGATGMPGHRFFFRPDGSR